MVSKLSRLHWIFKVKLCLSLRWPLGNRCLLLRAWNQMRRPSYSKWRNPGTLRRGKRDRETNWKKIACRETPGHWFHLAGNFVPSCVEWVKKKVNEKGNRGKATGLSKNSVKEELFLTEGYKMVEDVIYYLWAKMHNSGRIREKRVSR